MDGEFWNKQYMLALVFDVERGNCGFVRTASKNGILLTVAQSMEPGGFAKGV
jgi:hypothetical protein